jgi:hypothetical protein
MEIVVDVRIAEALHHTEGILDPPLEEDAEKLLHLRVMRLFFELEDDTFLFAFRQLLRRVRTERFALVFFHSSAGGGFSRHRAFRSCGLFMPRYLFAQIGEFLFGRSEGAFESGGFHHPIMPQLSVSISTPLSVMATVCSKCAARLPSTVFQV